jgi:hypothetical protein
MLAVKVDLVLLFDWFRHLADAPEEIETSDYICLYFRKFGSLAYEPPAEDAERKIDAKNSPLVSLFCPSLKRGVIWTMTEAHFLPARKRFPQLDQVNRQFRSWLSQYDLVFSPASNFHHRWDYYLEGSFRNYDSDVYALPYAMRELRSGRYFVSAWDNRSRLDDIIRELRKRGVQGIKEE